VFYQNGRNMSAQSDVAFLLPHSHEEACYDHPVHPIAQPREEGYLQVSDTHALFYAIYGNPNGIPVVVLHGGPGAGCDDGLCRFFDLNFWNVVMFDQRGAMRSKPLGCMEENSPQHSIRDIETLRKHLGIEKWVVFGGSWGSTLAILYGQEHPMRCTAFILRGIFLGREPDYLHLFYGMGKVFPEACQPFLDYIPEEERKDLLGAYYRRIMDPDPEVHKQAAYAFTRFDLICSTHLPNPEALERLLRNEKMVYSVSKAFVYYAYHRFFLEPNQILSRMQAIAHLPAVIVHGRWDAICLPQMAYALHQKWDNSMLWMAANGGHSANSDPAIAMALAKATDFFAEKMK
jgi:proline iminopeptidase